MKSFHKFGPLLTIFLTSWSLLLLYLAAKPITGPVGFLVFWILLLALVATFYGSCLNHAPVPILMSEAFLLVATFFLVYYFAPPVGPYQYDSLLDFASTRSEEH